jgi:predicted dehydrogenase
MTQQRIRWGILGTGGIANKFAADLRLLPDAELAAVGSRSAENAKGFAERYGAARAYGSVGELAADENLDVVYVATPHAAHHAGALACLRAGRAVLCEKPITLDRASAAELVDLARQRDVFLMEAMWMRCQPAILRMMDLIRVGAIGTVTAVHADFALTGPFPPTHRLRARELGGGALLDLGVYPISLAHLVLGRPDHIRAWAALSPQGVDENTGVLFGYDSGAIAALSCGLGGATRNAATITGTLGRIELPPGFHRPEQVVVHRHGASSKVLEFASEGFGYHHEAAEVQRCLRAGVRESPLLPHAVTLEIMGLLDTIRADIGVSYVPGG